MVKEQQQLKLLRSQLQKLKTDFVISEAKVSALKQQLQNAEKASTATKLKVQKMSSQVRFLFLIMKAVFRCLHLLFYY